MFSKLAIFGFVIRKNDGHFFKWDNSEAVVDKTKARASLSYADLFEGLHKNESLGSIATSCGKNTQWGAPALVIYALI